MQKFEGFDARVEQLLDLAKTTAVLADSKYHGVTHWLRVRHLGLSMAPFSGADPKVVEAFAILHDTRRYNEDEDQEHGQRAARWAHELWRCDFPMIRDFSLRQMVKLKDAIKNHSDGDTSDDPTIGTCWDADRLDLGRVGIMPVSWRLSTQAARDWLTSQPQLFAPPARVA